MDISSMPIVPFGGRNTGIESVVEGIRTFTESVHSNTVSKVKEFIAGSRQLVFLGFGFLPQNIELLAPMQGQSAYRIHATTVGISDPNKMVVKDQLRRLAASGPEVEFGEIEYVAVNSERGGYIDVANSDCRNLIENHSMRFVG